MLSLTGPYELLPSLLDYSEICIKENVAEQRVLSLYILKFNLNKTTLCMFTFELLV